MAVLTGSPRGWEQSSEEESDDESLPAYVHSGDRAGKTEMPSFFILEIVKKISLHRTDYPVCFTFAGQVTRRGTTTRNKSVILLSSLKKCCNSNQHVACRFEPMRRLRGTLDDNSAAKTFLKRLALPWFLLPAGGLVLL